MSNLARKRADATAIREERRRVYSMPYIEIDLPAPTTHMRCHANNVFDSLDIKGYKKDSKRIYFMKLHHAGVLADYFDKPIACSRNKDQLDGSLKLQVVRAAIHAGLFREYRSPKGSPRMSRLIPTGKLTGERGADPWSFDPVEAQKKRFVYLRNRETKEDMPFNKSAAFPAEVQLKLETVNHINAMYEITGCSLSEWGGGFAPRRRLRPVHYAVFSNTFDLHGRIYTGKYGHQGMSSIERRTIRFNAEQSVEHDYSGLHPRLAYHLEGINYQDDPYELWSVTTPPMRLMAKTFINALINAESTEAAVSASNLAMMVRGKEGKKAIADSRELLRASKVTGLRFSQMVLPAFKKHRRIADKWFGSDGGVRLMRVDSEIALEILHYFTKHYTPCLGVHDSFIVPATASDGLFKVMLGFYETRVGFFPVIKRGSAW